MSLLEKLSKNSKIKEASVLEKSSILEAPYVVKTMVPNINIALSGDIDSGLRPGFLQVAGPSKHFKTNISLVIISAFMKQFKDSIVLFYDSEFGASKKYFESAGVDTNRVLHCPITNIEELKFDIMSQLKEIKRGDKALIFIDSIGNLASIKEVEDAIEGKSVADMSRAKALKSLFRMITPHLTLKGIPLIGINHTYKEIGMFPKDIVGGGTGGMYSANDVWIISRSQEKVDGEVQGWTFTINIEKSRSVKEKSKIPVTVMYDEGIRRESGLMDLALELGYIIKPNVGWYSRVNVETGEVEEKKYRAKDLNYEWFEFMLNDDGFKAKVKEIYQLANGSLITDAHDEYSTGQVDDDE